MIAIIELTEAFIESGLFGEVINIYACMSSGWLIGLFPWL